MALNFPTNPAPNQLWTDPTNNYTYQWKVDPQSLTGQGKWVNRVSTNEDNLSIASSNPGPVAPENPFIGQFWFDPTGPSLYTWYDDGTGPQWTSIT